MSYNFYIFIALGFIVISFFVIRYIDYYNRNTGSYSKLTKGRCYFILGVLTVLYIIVLQPNDMGVSAFAGTLCFIESIDLHFEQKKKQPIEYI